MEKKDALNAVLNVHVTPEDYRDQVNEEVKKYAKKASLPGFRPGKVPKGMVRKMLGLGVVMEEVSKVVSKSISEHIRDEKLNVLGDPMPVALKEEEDFDLDCTKDIDFAFELGIAPEFDLNLEFSKPVPAYKVEVDDAIIEKELNDQRDRHGELIYPETVEEGDIVFGKIAIKDAEAPAEGEEPEGKLVVINEKRFTEEIDTKKVFKPFLGKKVEDVIKFDLKIFGSQEQARQSLMLDEDEFEKYADQKLNFEVRRISRTGLAEMNEAFFEKMMPGEEIKDEAELRAKLSDKLKTDLDRAATYRTRDDIRKALMENHTIELPDEFLKRWMLREYEQVNEENVDTEYPQMAEGVRWSLIVERIQKAHPETEVKSEDVEEEVTKAIAEMLGETPDPEMEARYKEHIMGNQEMVKNYYSRVLNDRLFGVLEEKIKTKAKKITASAFIEEQNKQ
ncbi:MAG: trigger factor [Bacteroidia bacterium]